MDKTTSFSTHLQKAFQVFHSCMICATNNLGRAQPESQAALPPPDKPFDHITLDFIELTPAKGKNTV